MMSKKESVLFVSYNGLLDPLGGSQILPYVQGIARHPRPVRVMSFEKPDRFATGAGELRVRLAKAGIEWTPLTFTSRFGKLGKLWDLGRMYATCLALQLRYKFDVIHCRAYLAMQVGCLLHKLTGARTIFDIRGLWVDERVDGGLWKTDRLVDRLAYRAYKGIEAKLIKCASHIVVLTDRVMPEIRRLAPETKAPIVVVPCCADFDHFVPLTAGEQQESRAALGISADSLVLSYLGSLGTWYMLDRMLGLFAEATRVRGDVDLLFITRDWGPEHEAMIQTMGLKHLRDRIHVRPASRAEVPKLLGASDIMLSFITPSYSKMASSPTKLAEAFALGIPVISNAGVGDVDTITPELDAGAVIDLEDEWVFERLVPELDQIRAKGGAGLRERARERFGLEVAERLYRSVYDRLENSSES